MIPPTRSQHSFAVRPLATLIALLLPLVVAGCGSTERYYPEVAVTTPIGHEGVCHQCGKKIPMVEASHVIEVQAAQYVVCSPECDVQIRKWHAGQFGGK